MAVKTPKKPARLLEADEDRVRRETFIRLFLASGRLTAEVEALCREEGIAMPHYTILWFLARRPEPEGVPMGAVVDGQLTRASDSTRLADRLADRGLIERSVSPTDRRVVLLRLTEAGRDCYLRLTRRIQDLHREQWSPLEPAELQELRRLLGKVLAGKDGAKRKLRLLAAGDDTDEGA